MKPVQFVCLNFNYRAPIYLEHSGKMTNNYEAFAKLIVEQSAQDKRAQPWKGNVKTSIAAHDEEWVEINTSIDNNCEVDVRTNAFPLEKADVRMNAFPMGTMDIRTNSFPMGGVAAVASSPLT